MSCFNTTKTNIRKYKIVLLGTKESGKCDFAVRYVQGHFVEKYDPTIEDSYFKNIEIDGQEYELEILDTAGTEHFTAMRDLYIKDGNGFILIYNITDKTSFNELDDIRDQIIRIKGREDFPCVMVGNKLEDEDQRVISKELATYKAKKFGCKYMETSSKNTSDIDKVFSDVIRQLNN